MKLEEVLKEIWSGRWFSIRFWTRREPRMPRQMRARTKVNKYVKGVGLSYDPKEKDLIPCWENNPSRPGSENYRMIPIEGIVQFKVGEEWMKVDNPHFVLNDPTPANVLAFMKILES